MTPVAYDWSRLAPVASCVRLLMTLSLLAGLFPVLPAFGGSSGKRLQVRKVPPRKRVSQANQGRLAHHGPAVTARSPAVAATAASPPAGSPQPTIEEEMVALTNQDRQANGLPALTVDARLMEAAQIQADAMASIDVLDHELPGAAHPGIADRMQYVGFNYRWAAENIADIATDIPTLESLWMNSPLHRANILSPFPTSIGVAVAYDAHGVPYYCVEFGVSY